MRCPRCETVVMEEIDRSGVTLDRCPSCRGVFLDRGELEKITARASAELEPRSATPRYRDDDPPSSGRGHHRHKRSFWQDIFD
ncbi:MAG TPA: zf-TFIIB domain-containing protein [Polyangiaceae bacterium]|nr:zf-TFIIB domain-containing protein [Polyangiaceae bacterium]